MTFNPTEQREYARKWIRKAATAQDANQPLKSLDEATTDDAREALHACQIFNMIAVDDVSDEISVTIEGRMFAGLIVGDVPDFGPGKLATLVGSITETELAARYVEGKVRGIEEAIRRDAGNRDNLEWLGRILKITADEFRQQIHIPDRMIQGRVIPYNDDNETGVKHEANLTMFFSDVHERNVRAGWWSDLETGEPKKRNVGELFMLFVTEIAEAYWAYLDNAEDDKLPEYPGLGVEIGDLAIRMADFAGAAMAGKIVAWEGVRNPGEQIFRKVCELAADYEAIRKTPQAIGDPELGDFLPAMNIGDMVDAKLAFNAKREDHKIENRLKEDGKKT